LWTGTTAIRVIDITWVLIIVPQSADLEAAFTVMLFNTVTSAVVGDGSVGPADFTGAWLTGSLSAAISATRSVLAAGGVWSLAGVIPVVVGAHFRAVIAPDVFLNEVTGDRITSCGGILTDDPRARIVGAMGVGIRGMGRGSVDDVALCVATAVGKGTVDGFLGHGEAAILELCSVAAVRHDWFVGGRLKSEEWNTESFFFFEKGEILSNTRDVC
jgi:hypothetical protein